MRLRSAKILIKDAWNIYYQNKGFWLRVEAKSFIISVLVALAMLFVFVPPLFILITRGKFTPLMLMGIIIIGGLIGMVPGFWLLTARLQAAWQMITQNITSPDDVYKAAWKKWPKIFVIYFLTLLIILGGLVLFIIPGIVFGAWFSLAPFIAIAENVSPTKAFSKSKYLVSQAPLPVLGRLLLTVLHTPGFPISPYLIYQDLVKS